MMPRKLVKMINNETNIPAGRINDVKILDSFSFLTVSFEDAEVILKSFNSGKGKKQAIVQKANDSKEPEKDRKKRKRK
jgi:ATP-dependent RNA helicase DeaD